MGFNVEDLKNNRLIRHCYYYAMGTLKKTQMLKKAKDTMAAFGADCSQGEKTKKQLDDMLRMYKKHGYTFEEYMDYDFANKSEEERLRFVADWEHLGYTNAMNDYANASLFDNKWLTYNKFREFYKRELIFCDGSDKEELFLGFAGRNAAFAVKPLDESCGKGFQILSPEKDSLRSLFTSLLSDYNGRFIAEELIRQDEEIKKLHPSSVNTVRCPAVRFDSGEVRLVYPLLRVGQHGNLVDNAGAGGICCIINPETGVIYAAADNKGHHFTVHPDTNEQIIGFKVPKWDELVELVTRLAKVVPTNRYAGWDLALTDEGWIMVEANRRGQFLSQTATKEGFRSEIDGILKELGRKY